MNPELQTVLDRLELVERQSLGWKLITVLALAVAVAAVAAPFVRARPPALEHARFSVVEANRIQLRGPDGSIAAELAASPETGSVWFLLGRRATGCAQLVVLNGQPSLTMADSKGRMQIALDGSENPGLYLKPGNVSGVTLRADATKGGEIWVRDGQGRPRFHAP
jgi:hypothetical protein